MGDTVGDRRTSDEASPGGVRRSGDATRPPSARPRRRELPTAPASGRGHLPARRRDDRRCRPARRCSTPPRGRRASIAAPCGGQGRCGRCRSRSPARAVERRDNSRLTAAEVAAGAALACQTLVDGPVEVTVPRRRHERGATARPRRGRARGPAGELRLAPQPGGAHLRRSTIEPPSLADNTSDFDRLRRALAQQHGIKDVRAELPLLRGLSRDLREADWKVSVALEMRDWVYGTYLPPRLLRVYPSAFGQRTLGLAVDLGTTSVVAYLVDFETARVVDTASAYNKQIACGEDVISRIIYAKRKGGLERLQRLAVRDDQRARRRAPAGATASSPTRSTRSRGRQHDDDPPAARPRPALPARGAVHPHRDAAAQAHRRRARPGRQPAGARALHAGRGQLRRRRHHRRRHLLRPATPPSGSRCSSTSAPTARWCWATRSG